MRAFLVLAGAILASIGLGIGVVAAVGMQSEAGASHLAETSIASLANSPYLQLSGSVSGSLLGTSPTSLGGLNFDIDLSVDNGASTLAAANLDDLGLQFVVSRRHTDLVTLREIDGAKVFVKADLGGIAQLPGISPSMRNTFRQAAPLLDGRWFRLPKSVVAPLMQKIRAAERQQAKQQTANSKQAQQALANRLRAVVRRNTKFSVSENAQGQNDVRVGVALGPLVAQLEPIVLPFLNQSTGSALGPAFATPKGGTSPINGNAVVDLLINAATGQLHQIRTVYTSQKGGLGVVVNVAHANTTISAPAGAVLLPNSVINGISKAASSSVI